ncbi:putative bifunctional UDP-N-acetylglucosamine transferase and deubiquitinase ALG13 isoform X1 [Osmerus eperlanus]|uniref:putative bifunctional UDP-N-acetylglucosamine transferase and deubiquitinase ALG13 isoform X1 n=2 Tax=Osmerus eperlanus TaxID=29151 RepID=UPI002E14500E
MQKALKKYFVNMDEYLASIGLYRKMMARDASCLFRAVSEQLYYSQNYHSKIRKDCVSFMRTNRCNFEPYVEGSFEKYLERIEDPKETAGQVEIKALSLLYRRCFLIYRYPGKPPTEITEEDYVEQILLCCSNNGHYDIVYPRNYPIDSALCQSILYELLYTRVLGVEEAELQAVLEGFRGGGRRYRNSLSVCSEDAGYDTPEDRAQREDWELGGQRGSEEKNKTGAEEPKATEGPSRLSLPYKVLKALDTEMYRNVEFDVWHDGRKEMQKSDYMVFAGRQYFLGDKCQVRLDPKGKFYNAFIQEVGTHTSAVTVFIEELGEKHLVSLTNLKPVNPVPAWNITPSRKGSSYTRPEQYPGELDCEGRGRRRFFKRPRGKEMLMVSYSRPPPPGLPPRFQPGGIPPGRAGPPPPPGSLPYDPYHQHPPPSRTPRGYGPPRSSARFLNRPHLIGAEMYYPHPGKRCYQTYDNYSFRSRRSRRQSLNKECQFSYASEGGEEESQDLGTITYYQLEEGEEAFSALQAQSSPSYWVQRGPSPLPPQTKHTLNSSEEDLEEGSNAGDQGDYSEEYIYAAQDTGFQSPSVYAATESTANLTIQGGGSRAGSPQEGVATYSYSQQVVVKSAVLSSSQAVNTAPAAIFTSNSSSSSSSSSSQTPPDTQPPPPPHTQGGGLPPHALGRPVVSMQLPPPSPWLVNEMGEPISAATPPPPCSYDPHGQDLPRDSKVLQYYFNLGVQWYQQFYWQSVMQFQQVFQPPSAEYQPAYPAPPQEPPAPPAYPPDNPRPAPEAQGDGHHHGPPLGVDPPLAAPPPAVLYPVYQEPPHVQPYDSCMLSYHYLAPPWMAGHAPNHAQPRPHSSYCPSHLAYVSAPPTHHTHFIPPSM